MAVNDKITFTESESKLLISIMSKLKSDIQFDAEAVAAELNYKDASVVRARWNQIKRTKLRGSAGASSSGVKKSTKKTAKAPKRAAVDDDGMEGDDDEEKAPAKPARKAKKVKKEDAEEA